VKKWVKYLTEASQKKFNNTENKSPDHRHQGNQYSFDFSVLENHLQGHTFDFGESEMEGVYNIYSYISFTQMALATDLSS
jgi:hypothetical protein